jgi:hypothetical protein
MNEPRVIVLVVLVVVIVTIGAFVLARTKQRTRLRAQFGPEYRRAVETLGSETEAESVLKARRARVARLDLRRLPPPEAQRFAAAWRAVQARFVDDPAAAIAEVDRLVQQVMEARGYPVGDFEQRAEDVSVHHAAVVDHYRAAHAIAVRGERGEATTEDLRLAIKHYRALFDDLLEVDENAHRRMEARG